MTEPAHPIDLNLVQKLGNKEYRQKFFLAESSAHIAEQLIALRKRRGLDQTQLAEMIGTQQPAISRVEKADYQNWSFNTLRKIADAEDARVRVSIQPAEDVLKEYETKAVEQPIDKELVSDEPTFFDSSNSWFLANLGASQFTYEDLYHHSKLDIVWPNLSGLALTNTYSPSVAKSALLKLRQALANEKRKTLELEKEIQRLNDERKSLLHNQGFEFQQYSHIASEAMIRRDQQRSGLII